MDRKIFNRGAFDLLIGVICGGLMFFSAKAYIALWFVAVIGALLIMVFGGNMSNYGNNEKGDFRGTVVAVRIITANVGAVIGSVALEMAF